MDSAQERWRKHGRGIIMMKQYDEAICIRFRVKAEEEPEVQRNSAVVLLWYR